MGAQDVPPVSPSSSTAAKPLETIGEGTKMPSLEKKPATAFTGELSRQDEPNVYVSLTYDALDATAQMARVKSAKAGAVVLFAGTAIFFGCDRDGIPIYASSVTRHVV